MTWSVPFRTRYDKGKILSILIIFYMDNMIIINVMIDTLNISIDRSGIDENIDLIEEIGARIDVNPYDSNELKVEGKLGNLKVVVTGMEIRIYGSIAKYLKGDNLETLSLEKLKMAIEKLEKELGIPVRKGRITRVDMAGTFQMKKKPLLYLKKLGWLEGFFRSTYTPDSLYYTRGREREKVIQLSFYDKGKEMRGKGLEVPPGNLLRYECRFFRRGIRWLFKRDLTVDEILDEKVFNVFISRWHELYTSIFKLGTNYLDVSFNSLESSSDWGALCLCQMNTQIDVLKALKDVFSCRKERRAGDVSLHNRLKTSTLKMLERGKRFTELDNLIEELNFLVESCYGERFT